MPLELYRSVITCGSKFILHKTMIRQATADDKDSLLAIAQATGLFAPEELEGFGEMMDDQLSGAEEQCWIADDENGIVGAAYYAPEPFAEGVWNLYFIGVHPDEQGKGRGSALIRYVEERLRKQGDRLLLVETSAQESFEATRTFYRKNGYDEEARIRDYYKDGDDKIIFRKAL